MDTLRNESNEKVKQVLLPQQYEEYQKIENRFYGGMMGGGAILRSPGAGQGETPQPPPQTPSPR